MTDSLARTPEYWDVQLPAMELLAGTLGYVRADGASVAEERASESEVLLTGRLARKLREINEGLSESGVKQAIEAIRTPMATGFLEANEKLHRILSRWCPVEEMVNGQPVGRSVRYIDFDTPENNEFLVVEEFTVKGPFRSRRMDLTIFVNGIPIAVIECKEPGDPQGIEHAVDDLLAYQDRVKGVPRLFHTVQFCMATKKVDARYGTVTTPLNHYSQWKSVYPMTLDELREKLGRIPTPQDVMLAGLLSKANLLEHIRTFVAFDREGGRVVKKIARYQQYEAVNLAVKRIIDPADDRPRIDRGGIVWHTQGSGKSLTMLWLAVKLRRAKVLDNPTLLIVTDRRDLDRQITDTFINCGFENPVRAERVRHLRRLLDGAPGQTLMTTVQKFRDEVDLQRGSRHPVLSTNDNIIVLIDEAHRSEYGLFNAHLRRALPNACLLAFTGTPITKTTQKFGSYIHKYTMPQSVADGATVPILYESRLPELTVWGGKRLEPLFEAEFSHLTAEQRKRLIEQEVRERTIAEAPDRIEAIAADIAQHYAATFEPDGFKAQVVACSQEAAAQYLRQLSRYFPNRVALLISDPAKKNSELLAIKEQFADEEAIIDQFKYEGVDRLAIIVVVDKYLTGFDAPIERVLYLDKPLREHNLLQAIARVNRPLPERDKTWGLIVDYWGVSGFLDRALQAFSDDLAVDQVMCRRDDDEAYEDLRARRKDVFAIFPSGLVRTNVEPWVLTLEKEDVRARFLVAYRAFYQALERLLPDERALQFLGDFAWLRKIRREMVAQFSIEDLDLVDCSARVRELIDKHVRGEDIRVLLEPVPILSDDFTREIEKLSSARAKASRMEHAIARTITVRVHEDPVFFESIRERLERIIVERRNQRIDDVKEFQLLLALREDVVKEQRDTADSLGLDSTGFAFYGLLKKELAADEGNTSFDLKGLTDQIVAELHEEAVIDWVHKEDVQREMRRRVKRQLRLAGCSGDAVESLATSILDLARVRLVQ